MRAMKTPFALLLALAACLFPLRADEAWKTLFNGKDFSGWQNAKGGAPANWKVEDGLLTWTGKGGDIWTKERYGDFVLELEFKTTGNSGVFIRTDDPKDNVQTGIEMQVHKPGDPGRHSVGAIYDLVPPTENAATDGWNTARITARGAHLSIELNGKKMAEMNLDQWTEAGKNPDGSANKFRQALKDFKREGHIGLQDHGDRVWYRHIRLRAL